MQHILVFDSGVGGLSIYEEMVDHVAGHNAIYLFDNKCFPYGVLSEETIANRLIALFEEVAKRHTISLAVVACNTATVAGLERLRQAFAFPIIGVVPAIKAAVARLKNRDTIIGLVATQTTLTSAYTERLIREFCTGCAVEKKEAGALVWLAEKKLRGIEVKREELASIFAEWFLLPKFPEIVVLGCTHFPLLRHELRSVFPDDTVLVDSTVAIAQRVAYLIAELGLALPVTQKNIAYCTLWNASTAALQSIFWGYGFENLTLLG